jgi:hypothetical protein
MRKLLGLTILCGALIGTASADGRWDHFNNGYNNHQKWGSDAVATAPEIDPASALSGLTLLVGGIAVMRGRRK